ncbi:MAG: hypothetical protein AAF602_13420, partial [Myxococcota bacterium]
MNDADLPIELARMWNEIWWSQFWLIVTTTPLLLWVGHLFWYMSNDQLARRWPERFFAVRARARRPWWLRLPWFEARARRLRAAGFAEVGIVVERLALTRCTQSIWWSRDRSTWAIVLGPIAWFPETVLVSPLADGSLLVTSPAVPESTRIRHLPPRGHRIEEHEAHRIERGPPGPTQGTLPEAVELLDTMHHLFARPGPGEPPADLARPPADVTVDHDLHGTRVVFPFETEWFVNVLTVGSVGLVASQSASMVHWVLERWPEASAVALLGPIGSIFLVIGGSLFLSRLFGRWPMVWLTPNHLVGKPRR